ncbi:hypothetical protein Godav_006396 [Gossypium davidsonii]|uniref:Uncharacterized protein n=1 Tax=Gossypium davidsonii TaxID=34287 RepID=A0A7J8S3L8_GOSDV|nr:hypothetical protein [Gossypium davidsonii]
MPKNGRMKIHWMRTNLTSVVPQPFLESEKVSYRIFSENYSSLKGLVATPRRDNITEEKWMIILQNLRDEEVEWRAL